MNGRKEPVQSHKYEQRGKFPEQTASLLEQESVAKVLKCSQHVSREMDSSTVSFGDMTTANPLVLSYHTALVLGVSVVVVLLYRVFSTYGYRPSNYPPGPPTVPILGNALDFPDDYLQYKFSEWGESLALFNWN